MRDDFKALRDQKLEQIGAYIGILSNQADIPLLASVESLAVGLLSLCEGCSYSACTPRKRWTMRQHRRLSPGISRSCCRCLQPVKEVTDASLKAVITRVRLLLCVVRMRLSFEKPDPAIWRGLNLRVASCARQRGDGHAQRQS